MFFFCCEQKSIVQQIYTKNLFLGVRESKKKQKQKTEYGTKVLQTDICATTPHCNPSRWRWRL
jgi:hypothetical protein